MVKPLDYLQKNSDWLICENSYQFYYIAQELYSKLTQSFPPDNPPKIILAEREPVKFLASFIAACAANCPVFLCNPDWGKQEWEQVLELVQPDLILGIAKPDYYQFPISSSPFLLPHSIMIPTGGSSGKIKFTIHTWETLMASVTGFKQYFNVKHINSFCILPLYHVSGLMQFIRSLTTNGKLIITTLKTLEIGENYNINPSDFFISLVPTQLQRCLQNPQITQWLSKFNTVLLGGAPAWDELLETARLNKTRLAPTYGMTETASQIATLKPDDFLQGKASSGQILPHAQVIINNENGEILNVNQIGNIQIKASSLALGYYPQIWKNQDYFSVDDLGYLDAAGYLNIIGRNSDKIITGGENVYPAEIEAAIRKTQLVNDVCVIGIPDQYWGQAVTAIYIPQNSSISDLEIQAQLKNQLTKYKIPKYWLSLPTLPRNHQGKINRQVLQNIAQEFLKTNQQLQHISGK
ncbi:MAG TPA: 2-succinylbenzoate--CoA ligase [Nostocaceae cyanobacterium]|nr:2-succinylbenzoate--CoA ligase [Nostocaceae cyanobacterium]